jgi:hypothetical protein
MSREVIHLGVHNHFVVDGKCQKSVEETKRLIAEKVDHTPDVNIFLISLSASKTFLVSYLVTCFLFQVKFRRWHIDSILQLKSKN